MNNLYARNNNIGHSDALRSIQAAPELPTWYNDHEVWLPQPSIHALSPPMHLLQRRHVPLPTITPTASNLTKDRLGGTSTDLPAVKQGVRAPAKAHHRRVGVPKTITIPAIPVTPEMHTTFHFTKITDDDCSSIGMGTLGKNKPRTKRRRDILDDDSSIESLAESYKRKRKCLKRHEPPNENGRDVQSSSIISPPQDLKWDGSLSYLDGLAEHERLMDSSSHATSTKIEDNMSIGTFTIAGDDNVSKLVAYPDDLCTKATHVSDDDSSMESDDGETVVLVTGTSIPQLEPPTVGITLETFHWDGSLTFLDCFDKNASLMDFLDAEATAM